MSAGLCPGPIESSPYGTETNDPVPRNHQGGCEYWRGSNILEFASDAYDFHLFDEEGRNHRYAERYLDHWVPPDLKALGGASARQLPGYYGLIKKLDEALERIDDALISLDLEENTIGFFISDHGCHFHTRIGYDKRSGHESSVRIPCMAKGPCFNQGGQIRRLFSLVDVAPRIVDAEKRSGGQAILPANQMSV